MSQTQPPFEQPGPSTGLGGWGTDFRIALGFLTRLPVPFPAGGDLSALARAYRAFPLVGLVVGAAAALVHWAATGLGLGPAIAAVMAVGAAVAVCGGLHEDGLADVADGLGGGSDRDSRLAIMRDSRVGAYGVMALVLVLGLQATIVATLATPDAVAPALLVAAVLSRAAIPPVAAWWQPARRDGLGAGAGRPAPGAARWSVGVGAILAILIAGPGAGLAAIGAAAVVAYAVGGLANHRIGGYTGDVLGTVQKKTEIAVLLALVAAT